MKYALFVGCTTLSRLPGYEKSARNTAKKLGIELVDMPGSSCCGTTYLETLDKVTALTMAARNLAIAEELGLDIVTICNGCTEVLTKANKELKENQELREKVNQVLAKVCKEFKGKIKVKHYACMLKNDYGLENIEKKVVNRFTELKVGSHYGCHMLKPSDVLEGEDPENPRVLDELVSLTGATPIEYPNKLECCAGPLMGVRENVTWQTGLDKVKIVKKLGDTLTTACPFCYLTYERSQLMNEEESPDLPIIHLPQLLGLALGLDEEEVGLADNKIDTRSILEKLE